METPASTRHRAHGVLPEAGTNLLLHLKCLHQQVRARCVGQVDDVCLITSMPLVPGILTRLREDNGVMVRYEHQGTLHQFDSHVLNSITRPTQLLFIAPPTHMQSMNLRRWPRIHCGLPAALEAAQGAFDGMILDLSMSGARVRVPANRSCGLREAAVGDLVELRFCVGHAALRNTAVIRRLGMVAEAVSLGVSFTEFDPVEYTALTEYLDRLACVLC